MRTLWVNCHIKLLATSSVYYPDQQQNLTGCFVELLLQWLKLRMQDSSPVRPSLLSRPLCLSCWTTSAWWHPSAHLTGWPTRTLPCASARSSSHRRRRPGGPEEEQEELEVWWRDWATMRKLQVLWILSGTSRRCTTCYSCGQVRTTFHCLVLKHCLQDSC